MTTNLYLDRRGSDTLAQIKIAINHKGDSSYIGTGIRIEPNHWDKKGQKVKKECPNASRLNIALTTKKLDVDNALEALRREGRLKGLTAAQMRKALVERLSPEKEAEASTLFLRRLERYRDGRKKIRTWESYDATMRKIRAFDAKADTLAFSDITHGWLVRFDDYLAETSPSANARNIYLRNIRRIFNVAIDDGVTDAYPFRRFKIRAQPTKSRALTAEQLRTLFNAAVEPHQRQYLDIFKLSFFLAGLNIADLVSVRKIDNGRIQGRRAKTGQPFSFRVEPEALDIINRYRGVAWLLDIRDRYRDYRDWLHRMNDALKRIGTHYDPHAKATSGEPLFPDISSYYARYAWANIAAELGVPNEVIDAALGHKVRGVISVYVRLNYDRKVDEANRRVIDFVLNGS